ncbi:MAG TPA: glutamate 5-kinase, partial [Gammaproteobacteria bacterium]|nr:glutamate 5-kinase [Gammaproteobacteria bacterium]
MSTATHVTHAERLANARRVVIKIGSALFIDQQTGTMNREWLEGVCADVADMRRAGKDVVIVSSGAVALGRRELNIVGRLQLEEKQAAAAAGQIVLAHAYQEILRGHGITTAQVLLTLDDSERRERYLNASKTLLTLLGYGAVPVINENDTVATQELRYGDNDRLSARVAQMVSAECLVVLSDVDGLYTADPRLDANARYVDEVTEVTRDVLEMAGGTGSSDGSGGMRTKVEAARIAVGAGCRMCIATGRIARPINALLQGGKATWFLPSATPGAARKQWIAGTLKPKGTLRVDAGAERA